MNPENSPHTLAPLASLLLVFLACGGAVGSSPNSGMPAPTEIVVIGNSLSSHPPEPGIGWSGTWGMAASSAEKDFAHLVGSSLNLPLTTAYFVGIEMTPDASGVDIPIWAS